MIGLPPRLAEDAVPTIRRRGKDRAMRRPVLLAVALLSVLTALALLVTAVALRPPTLAPVADGSQDAAARALAYRFYDAANAAIATGDAAPLAALVAPGFVERGTPPDAVPDRDGLVRRILAIHAAHPGLRLGVEAVAADGDLVVVAVRVDGGAPPTLLGLRLDGAWAAWGAVDAFRVADGRIVERWGPRVDPALPVPGLTVTLRDPRPGQKALAATRLRLALGARHAAPPRNGPRLVVAESGDVAVSPAGARAAPPEALRAGEHRVLPAGIGYTVRNTGTMPAALLDVALVALPAFAASPAPPAPAEEGVATEILADDLLIDVPSPSAVLALGRTRLGPGERLAWAPAAGPVLVRVEAGELDLAATGSAPWVDGVVGRRSEDGTEAAIAAGGGALLETGEAAEVRAGPGVPAELLVLTLLPAHGPGPVPTAAPATGKPAAP